MRYVDLFCGAGGASAGLRAAGWECVGAFDNDVDAVATYGANFPDHPCTLWDLGEPLPPNAMPVDVDVVVGGPPCQDFSTACFMRVRRLGARSRLTQAFAERALALHPTWIVFENVAVLAIQPAFVELRARLHAAGYATAHRVVNTRAVGMAQPRKRLLLLAHADARRVAAAWAAFDALAAAAPPPPTLRETFAAHGIVEERNHCYYPMPNLDPTQKNVFALDTPADSPLFTVRARTRPMPASYVLRPRDSTRDRDDVFPVRTEHALALQGFPRDFVLPVRGARADKLVGNAVPPPLAALVARAVAAATTTLTRASF